MNDEIWEEVYRARFDNLLVCLELVYDRSSSCGQGELVNSLEALLDSFLLREEDEEKSEERRKKKGEYRVFSFLKRRELGLSQKKVSEEIGISQTAFSRFESGRSDPFRMSNNENAEKYIGWLREKGYGE